MSEVFSWVFGVLFVLVLAAWYLSYTAARLDRLHVRLSGTLAALDARLVRRAEAAVELANSGLLDGATSLLLANAAAGVARGARRSTARSGSSPRTTSPRPSTSR